MRESLISGQSGLCLLFCGAAAAAAQTAIARRSSLPSSRNPQLRLGWITGGGIFLAGCLIALTASIVNRNDLFDSMTASSLLTIAGLGAWLLVVLPIANRRPPSQVATTPHWLLRSKKKTLVLVNAAAILVLVALVHALVWNPTIGSWLSEITGVTGQIGHGYSPFTDYYSRSLRPGSSPVRTMKSLNIGALFHLPSPLSVQSHWFPRKPELPAC